MKLFFVKGFDATYKEVLDVVKSINVNAIVAVNEGAKGFELQDRKAAEEIVAKFGGTIEVIDFNVKDLMK